jgi:hypothetical protein
VGMATGLARGVVPAPENTRPQRNNPIRTYRPGRLCDFSIAKSLEVLRIPIAAEVNEADLAMIARAPLLRELSVQQAKLTPRAIDALVATTHLTDLDIEDTPFNDDMAERLARSRTISALDAGATFLTRAGLAHLCRMPQLRAIDLWATDIQMSDLSLLEGLPQLEYLSFGSMRRRGRYDPDDLVAQLKRPPTLKRLWVDGVTISQNHVNAIRAMIPDATISINSEDWAAASDCLTPPLVRCMVRAKRVAAAISATTRGRLPDQSHDRHHQRP